MALYRNIAGLSYWDVTDPGEGADSLTNPDVGSFYNPILKTVQTLDPQTNTPIYDPGIPAEDPVIQILPSPGETQQTELDPPYPTDDTPTIPLANDAKPGEQAVNYLPLVTAGCLLVAALFGERVLGKNRKYAFIAGLGALYYQYARKI